MRTDKTFKKKIKLLTGCAFSVTIGVTTAFGYAGEDILKGLPFHHFDISLRALAGDSAVHNGGDTNRANTSDYIFPGIGFSPKAATAIAWHADYIDSYLYSPIWWAQGFADKGSLQDKDNRLKASLAQFSHLERLHFDDLFTKNGLQDTWDRYGSGTLAGLEWAARNNDVPAAYNILGVSIHAVQDFYSHSNWIDDEANRNRTWQCSTPSQKARTPIYSGAYETPAGRSHAHHGKVSLECSVFRGNQFSEIKPYAEIICGGLSPYENSHFCTSFRQCPTGNTNVDVQTVIGTIPSGLVLNPPGIALDSSHLAAAGAKHRKLISSSGNFINGKQTNFLTMDQCSAVANFGIDCNEGWEGPKDARLCSINAQKPCTSDADRIFATSKYLATESTAQWVKAIDNYMSDKHSAFWSKVKKGQQTDVALRTKQYENFAQMPFQFLSAGPYPVANPPLGSKRFEKSADGWYIRLRLRTADIQGAGTDADIFAEVQYAGGKKEFLLDYMPTNGSSTSLTFTKLQNDSVLGRALVYNDFERGDNDVYTIGPIPSMPTGLKIKNTAKSGGQAAKTVLSDLRRNIANVFDISQIGRTFGSDADDVGAAHKTLDVKQLEAAARRANGVIKLTADGGSQGKHTMSFRVTDRGSTGLNANQKRNGLRIFEIDPLIINVDEESDVDGAFSASDEVFSFASVTAFNGELSKETNYSRASMSYVFQSNVEEDMDSEADNNKHSATLRDPQDKKWPKMRFLTAPNGAIVISARFFESDEETAADRTAKFTAFKNGIEHVDPAPFQAGINAIGSAAGSEWTISEIDAFGFQRGDTTRVKQLYKLAKLRTVKGGEAISLNFSKSAPKNIGNTRQIFDWTRKLSISNLGKNSNICNVSEPAQAQNDKISHVNDIPKSFLENDTVLFLHTENAALQGYNHKSFSNLTVNQCQSACINEDSFYCKSIDFNKTNGRCDLSKNDATGTLSLKTDYPNNPYDHYQRKKIFRQTKNAALQGYNHKSFSNLTIAQCQSACINEDSFYCKSIDFNKTNGRCDLSKNDATGTLSLKTDYPGNPYDHYQRITE